MSHQAGTVFSEDAQVVWQREYPEKQYLLRLVSPRCAAVAQPGQFIHLQCDPALRMRRPYSIMSASHEEIDILYRVVGRGSRLLSKKRSGDVLSVLGPIGNRFTVEREHPIPLLLGGGVGIPPILFLAQFLKDDLTFSPFAVFASERPFPFSVCESNIAVSGIGDDIRATSSELEELRMAARLCSRVSRPGCFNGYAHELAGVWLSHLPEEEKSRVEVFACGPGPMLAAVAALARTHKLPCQLSLEEYMACALGGCAGCVVQTTGASGVEMKRVCVDGPVFDAALLHL